MYRHVKLLLIFTLLVSCRPFSPPPQESSESTASSVEQSIATETIIPETSLPPTQNTTNPTSSLSTYEELAQLFDYDSQLPVSITDISVNQEDGYTLHDIHYPSPKGGNVTAYLLVPDGTGPFAGIILMHGSSGSRTSLLPLARDLVPTGAVVLTIDGPAARLENAGRGWITFTPQDREEQIQLIIDLRRGVDLLADHPSVDPSRLGYIGYSYGAAMGGLLAGVEHRIKAYGLMVGDGGLVSHFMEAGKPVGGFETIPAASRERWLTAMEPIDSIHFIGHASPSALFFQNARLDTLVSEADALAYQAAGSEPKKVEWYNSGHGLPEQAFFDMVHWLEEQIGIEADQFNNSR